MQIKILTNNIWRYYEWDKRKEKTIEFLKDQAPDVILFQETAEDERLKDKYKNQANEINKDLSYPYEDFGRLVKMEKWHDKPIDWEMYYGFGILSKFPIKKSEVIVLPHVEKKKNFGFMHSTIKTPKGDIDLINVHLENTNQGSKENLKKILEWCKKNKIKAIIAGDFNMKVVEDLMILAEKEYQISYLIKPYKSFMPTDFSHDKIPITLDYIISDKEKFEILDVECIQNDVSDHNPVIANIKIL